MLKKLLRKYFDKISQRLSSDICRKILENEKLTKELYNFVEPKIVKGIHEYLMNPELKNKTWDTSEMSLESYLGNKNRSIVESIENLRHSRKLNIGPGANWSKPGWESMDFYKTDATHILDMRNFDKFPFDDKTFGVIFSSHMIEHIDDEHTEKLIKESFRTLEEFGVLRLVTPDFDKALAAYYLNDINWFSKSGMNLRGDNVAQLLANWVVSYASFHEDGRVSYDGGPKVTIEEVENFLKSSRDVDKFTKFIKSKIPENTPYVAHVNGFTYDKLHKLLKEAGFNHIVNSGYRLSIIPELRQTTFDNHASASIFIDAFKFKN